MGATCRSSSNLPNQGCEKAIDGSLASGIGEWATKGQGIGGWITISFPEEYIIRSIHLMQRYESGAGQSREILISGAKSNSGQKV